MKILVTWFDDYKLIGWSMDGEGKNYENTCYRV